MPATVLQLQSFARIAGFQHYDLPRAFVALTPPKVEAAVTVHSFMHKAILKKLIFYYVYVDFRFLLTFQITHKTILRLLNTIQGQKRNVTDENAKFKLSTTRNFNCTTTVLESFARIAGFQNFDLPREFFAPPPSKSCGCHHCTFLHAQSDTHKVIFFLRIC